MKLEEINKVKTVNFVLESLDGLGYSVFLKNMDEFAYTKFKKEVVINNTLDMDARIFMLLHEYAHIKNGSANSGKTNFSIVFEKEDKDAFLMFGNIFKNQDALKKYSFIYNKISHLYDK